MLISPPVFLGLQWNKYVRIRIHCQWQGQRHSEGHSQDEAWVLIKWDRKSASIRELIRTAL